MVKLLSTPILLPCLRRNWAHSAWKVPILICVVCSGPKSLVRRSRISFAALLVNVTAHIAYGGILWWRMKYAMRDVRT